MASMAALIKRLAGYSSADQDKILSAFEAGLNSFVPKPPSFTLDMGPGDLTNEFGPDYELIEVGPEAETGKVSWSLVEYLEEGDPGYITGTVLRERAKKLSGFRGLKDGKRIVELQDKVSLEYRQNHYIPLPATLYRHRSSEKLCFPCLYRDGGRWYVGLYYVDARFGGNGRMVVPGKP